MNKLHITLIDKDGNSKEFNPSEYITRAEFKEAIDNILKELSNKQSKGNYITEHQSIKTLNGESLVGEGNVIIKCDCSNKPEEKPEVNPDEKPVDPETNPDEKPEPEPPVETEITEEEKNLEYIKDVTDPMIYIYWNSGIFDSKKDVIIPFYFTDFYQREYRFDNHNLKFKIRYSIDDEVKVIEDQKAGNYLLNLGKLSEGEHIYTLQVEDEFGNTSRRICYDILVRDEAANQKDIDEHTYIMQESDLVKYNINNQNADNDTDAKNTRVGLSKFFRDLADSGVRKVVLLKGIYRTSQSGILWGGVDKDDCSIIIPSHFEVDMNGATFKLHPYWEGSCHMVQFYESCDSHLYNGILEGGLEERHERGWYKGKDGHGHAGEGEHALTFCRSKFCSAHDVKFTKWSGYIAMTMLGDNSRGEAGIQHAKWENGIRLNEYNEETRNDEWSTSIMEDLESGFLKLRQIVASKWLGYGGVVGDDWEVLFNFYDKDDKHIEGIKVYQYTPCRIPKDAVKFRASIKARDVDIAFHLMPVAKYSAIYNCLFDDNETCVAPAQCRMFLFKDNEFTNSRRQITPCELDFEDGWEQTQDCFVINNKNMEVIDCAGINHQYIGNKEMDFVLRRGVNGYLIQDTINTEARVLRMNIGSKCRNGVRIFNNTKCRVSASADYGFPELEYIKIIVKNNKDLQAGSSDTFLTEFRDNLIDGNYGSYNVNIKNSTIYKHDQATSYYGDNVYYTDCEFIPNIGDIIKFSFNKNDAERIFTRCLFNAITRFRDHNYFNSGQWIDCHFNKEMKLELDVYKKRSNKLGDIKFTNCVFEEEVTIELGDTNDIWFQFDNCTFKKGIKYNSDHAKQHTVLNDCVVE